VHDPDRLPAELAEALGAGAAARQRGLDHGAVESAPRSRSARREPAMRRRRAKMHAAMKGSDGRVAARDPPRNGAA